MENPIYVGPMFVGHARFMEIRRQVNGCPRPGCGWLNENSWRFCPNCGHAMGSITVSARVLKPDLAELVQMRKRVRLDFNYYRAEPAAEAEIAEDYWLPAPGKVNTSLYVDVIGGQSKFAANLSFIDAKQAVEACELEFKEQLAILAGAYDTWTVRWGFFCWL